MDYTIDVSMAGGLLVVDPNPFPNQPGVTLGPGDTVTWVFHPSVGPGEMQVGFDSAQDLTAGGPPRRVGPMGPFDSISRQGNRITGTVGPGAPGDSQGLWRYLCVIFKDGSPLQWKDPARDETVGGGLDAARKPPP